MTNPTAYVEGLENQKMKRNKRIKIEADSGNVSVKGQFRKLWTNEA